MKKRLFVLLVLLAMATVSVKWAEKASQRQEEVVTIKTTRLAVKSNTGANNEVEEYPIINTTSFDDLQEQIRNEITYGDMELLAQLVHAEAGNQDLDGKRLVVDVVLNRVDYGFENNIEAVIFYSGAFTSVTDGNFDKAAYDVTEEDFLAVEMEMFGEKLDTEVVYFQTDCYSKYGTPAYKHGDHYFSTR